MLQIAICDDHLEQTVLLQKYIREFCLENQMEYRISLFDSGENLLFQVEDVDIVFLDIDMPKLDGIEVGRKIRRRNQTCRIIMSTIMVERMKEAFYIEAFRFITKPFDKAEVYEALDACVRKLLGNEEVEVYYQRNAYRIKQREIVYVVTYDSYSEFMVKDKILRSEMSLTEIEHCLDNRLFFRVHRKYIINMAFIQEYKSGKVYVDDQIVTVARRKKKEFERAFMEYDLQFG